MRPPYPAHWSDSAKIVVRQLQGRVDDLEAALRARGAVCPRCGALCLCFDAAVNADCPLHGNPTCLCGEISPPSGFGPRLKLV